MKSNFINTDEYPEADRQYKDRLFRFVFQKPEDLLSLYNAVNGTDYKDPDALEINTLGNVLYLSMKNDISFLVSGTLNLYEHQSTCNPNMRSTLPSRTSTSTAAPPRPSLSPDMWSSTTGQRKSRTGKSCGSVIYTRQSQGTAIPPWSARR